MNVSIYSGLLAVQNQNQIKCALFLKKKQKNKTKVYSCASGSAPSACLWCMCPISVTEFTC